MKQRLLSPRLRCVHIYYEPLNYESFGLTIRLTQMLIKQIPQPPTAITEKYIGVTTVLISKLRQIARRLSLLRNFRSEKVQIIRHQLEHARQLQHLRPRKFTEYLAHQLNECARLLEASGSLQNARTTALEGVGWTVLLHSRDPLRYSATLQSRVADCIMILRGSGNLNASVTLTRELHLLSPVQKIIRFTAQLETQAHVLYGAASYTKAAKLADQCVRFTRDLQKLNPNKYPASLAAWRDHYGRHLPRAAPHLTRAVKSSLAEALHNRPSLDTRRYVAHLSRRLNDYGTHLHQSGFLSEALDTYREAVEWSHEFDSLNPDLHTIPLADRLGHHGTSLLTAKPSKPGRAALSEATEVTKQIHRIHSNKRVDHLALSTSSKRTNRLLFHPVLSSKRADARSFYLSNPNTSLRKSLEAVRITRELYRLVPGEKTTKVADRLVQYGASLQEPPSYDKASEAFAEAVRIMRELYHLDPHKYAADFADRLSEYGASLRESQSYHAACEAFSEAVEITRYLRRLDPDKYAADVAYCLSTYGNSLHESKSYFAACEVSLEAMMVARELFQLNPDVYVAELAHCLRSYGNSLHVLGLYSAASEAFAEAVEMTRVLHHRNPDEHAAHLADCLSRYGASLHELESRAQAGEAFSEAVVMTRHLHDLDPDEFAAELALRLSNYGISLHESRSYEVACQVYMEAVAMTRELHCVDPDEFAADLVHCLGRYGISLHESQSYSMACENHSEAVMMARALFRSDPQAYAALLALLLNNYGKSLQAVGSYASAFEAHSEAVETTRQLYAYNPDQYTAELAQRLYNYHHALQGAGLYQQARQVQLEWLELVSKQYRGSEFVGYGAPSHEGLN